MNIKEFLRSHPLISPSSVERVLNMPKSIIRLSNDNPIPDKYKDKIIELLKRYDGEREGDNIVSTSEIKIKVNESSITPKGKECFVRFKKLGISTLDIYCTIYRKGKPERGEPKEIRLTPAMIEEGTILITTDRKIS